MPTLKVTPTQYFTQDCGEECSYTLDVNAELGAKTVSAVNYSVVDGLGTDVTDVIGGGSSVTEGIIFFGVKGASKGRFTLTFIVTCSDLLPNGVTPYEFYVVMCVDII